ncbi:hypothetical protein ACRAWF_39980 [Streptomyces sp. L7]
MTSTVDDDRTCSQPRNDPGQQAYQPTPNQVEWAVDMAIRGDLTSAYVRQGGWRTAAGLGTVNPQGMFPSPRAHRYLRRPYPRPGAARRARAGVQPLAGGGRRTARTDQLHPREHQRLLRPSQRSGDPGGPLADRLVRSRLRLRHRPADQRDEDR